MENCDDIFAAVAWSAGLGGGDKKKLSKKGSGDQLSEKEEEWLETSDEGSSPKRST